MRKILIVEDNADFATLIARSLRGADLFFATTMREAREKIWSSYGAREFDLVICDLELPDSSPRQTAAELPIYIRPQTAIAFMTGAADELPRACDAARHKILLATEPEILAFAQTAIRARADANKTTRALSALSAFADRQLPA